MDQCRHSVAVKDTSKPKRFFTPAEANKALVLVRRIVADISSDYAQLSELQEIIEAAESSGKRDQARTACESVAGVVDRIQSCADELEEIGVKLSDWVLGIVDFPSLAGGREVALCWQLDEPKVRFWHEVDSDHSQRKSIELLPADQLATAAH